MAIDKNFCMSSYLAFRYIEKDDMDFFKGMKHQKIKSLSDDKKTYVNTAKDIDAAIQKTFDALKEKRLGIMLSGGMDSAILASYMSGADAYTFRFLGGKFQQEELKRAEYYANRYGLTLHYVDISWDDVVKYLPILMKAKCAPVHSIEPQIYKAAITAKVDGIELMIIGDGSDYIFGGMDQLLSQDWTFDGFVKRYTYIDPSDVLKEPTDISYLFERYRIGENIDFIGFMDKVATDESYGSYSNAFNTADLEYCDPYEKLKLAQPLDLSRIRNGESKYLIRELFSMKYPDIPVPNKVPMPRPVDTYFADWKGPTRLEFKEELDMNDFTGNQKWQIWCLQEFLNEYDK